MKNENKKLSLKYQLKSFRWAIEGLSEFFKTEIKAWIHLFAAILAICASILFKLNIFEWSLILTAIFGIFITELMNTALERLSDQLPDSADSTRKTVKDMGAGIVLLAAVFALLIGMLVFLPKIILILK